MMPGGALRVVFLGLAMLGVVGAMYVAADQALERPRLLAIDAAVASTLSADYSSDPHPARPLPPLNPDIIGAAVEDLAPGAAPTRTTRPVTPTPLPTPPPASPTSAPLPTATARPQATATEEPPPTDTPEPEPSATDTPVPQPSPTATEEPKPTKTPDKCKKRPWDNTSLDHNDEDEEDEPCPTATPYKTPYIIPTEVPLPR